MECSKLKYTVTHEWVTLLDNIARVGITDHAQKEISDVVFVELPKPGRALNRKESAMVIESVKAAFDIYAPLSGKVLSVNEGLKNKPELVNQSPYEAGWLFEIQCSAPEEFDSLLTEDQYLHLKESPAH